MDEKRKLLYRTWAKSVPPTVKVYKTDVNSWLILTLLDTSLDNKYVII